MTIRNPSSSSDERELIAAASDYISGKISADEFEEVERKHRADYSRAARRLEIRHSRLGRIRRRLYSEPVKESPRQS